MNVCTTDNQIYTIIITTAFVIINTLTASLSLSLSLSPYMYLLSLVVSLSLLPGAFPPSLSLIPSPYSLLLKSFTLHSLSLSVSQILHVYSFPLLYPFTTGRDRDREVEIELHIHVPSS